MEGEAPEFAATNPEATKLPFLRVEFDGEHKLFVKQCTECGSEFTTGVPRKFFKNPDDESTKLHSNGSGSIDGYESIRGDDVMRHILNESCGDTARHAQKSANA